MFSIGYKQLMENMESYETYRASYTKYFDLIKPLLATNKPNVVLLPEAVGLSAALIGDRARPAREEAQDSNQAIASVAAAYGPQVSYYQSKCPGIPAVRAVAMAVSDTVWRGFGETLAEEAKKRNLYIIGTAYLPTIVKTTNASRVALLKDPQASGNYAYEAECDEVFNAAYAFAPTGEVFAQNGEMLVGSDAAQIKGIVPKAYLVPLERNQSSGLSISTPLPSDVRPVDFGFASFGVFTSKDAWMVDLPNRNDVDRADVFVQPEAGPWAGWNDTGVQDWQQDNIRRAVWGYVQKLPTIRWGAVTNLMGNLYELPFDGTPTITTDAPDFRPTSKGPEKARHFLLGRPLEDGIVARSRWVVPDPGPGLTFRQIKERREFLQAEGAKRAPESGAPEENAYVDDAFVWADVTLPIRSTSAALPPGPFSNSETIFRSSGAQWEPSLATAADGTLVAAWTDLGAGNEDALVARFDPDKGWTEPVNAGPDTSTDDDQTDNQYGATVIVDQDGKVHVVWLDFRNQSWDVRASSAPIDTLEFGDDVRVDHSKTSAEGFPAENLNNDPALVVLPKGTVIAAWDDLRSTSADRDIRSAALAPGGTEWTGDGFVSRKDSKEQFHPALATDVDGLVWAAWQDHRTGDADIRAGTSNDIDFGPHSFRVDDGPKNSDAYHPQIGASGIQAIAIWADDRSGVLQIRASTYPRVTADGSISFCDCFSKSVALAPSKADQTYPALANIGKNRWVAAWTDWRAGDSDIVLVTIKGTSGPLRIGRPIVVDDSGPIDSRMPALAYDGNQVWVAWEDRLKDFEQIRIASAFVSDLF